MKIKKLTVIICIIAVACSILTACSSKKSEETTALQTTKQTTLQSTAPVETATTQSTTEKKTTLPEKKKTELNINTIELGSRGENYTYEKMCEDLATLEETYPDRIKVKSLGKTLDKRNILFATVGNDKAEKHIIIQYSIHAREYINSLLAIRQLEDLLKADKYKDKSVSKMLNTVCLYIVPMTNPDGVTISQSASFEKIRTPEAKAALKKITNFDGNSKSAYRKWKANARGVDLNRNFNAGWEEYKAKKAAQGITAPAPDHYPGERYESEPEVLALMELRRMHPITAAISYHSQGKKIYYDYMSQGELKEKDNYLASGLADVLNGYAKTKTGSDGVDRAGYGDYMMEIGIPSVTIETGNKECPIPISDFEGICNQNKNVLPELLYMYSK